MARTYSSTPVLSKIQIGESTYYLKDADVRGILDAINADVYESLKLSLGTVGNGGDNLVTAGNIKSYVDSAIEAIPEFDVVVVPQGQDLPTASADTFHKIYLKDASRAGQSGNIYQEYITIRSGAGTELDPYTYSWELIGDTEIDLSGYVSDVKYVANTHKLQQQKGGSGNYTDIHQFGAMADADKGEVDLSGYLKGVSGKVTAEGSLVKDNTQGTQISGSIGAITVIDSVGAAPSFSEGAFTPASIQNGFYTAGSAASFSEGAFTANVPTQIDVTKFNGGSKANDTFVANTPTAIDTSKFSGGSKANDSFTANTPTVVDTTKFNGGSFVEGAFTPASLTTQTKALYKQGMKAEVGTGASAETLIISNVDKEADIKVVDTFDGGSKASDSFTGAAFQNGFYTAGTAAQFSEGAFTPASLASGFYTPGSAATYTEGAFTAASLGTGFYTAGTAASKAADTFVANTPAAVDVTKFSGGSKAADTWNAGSVPTTKSVTPVFTGDKFKFSGSEVNVTVTETKGQTEEVTPKASA